MFLPERERSATKSTAHVEINEQEEPVRPVDPGGIKVNIEFYKLN